MMVAGGGPSIAIACGGTGGHLFPGLAVAELLVQRSCDVTLLVSPKEVDQQALTRTAGMRIITLPAVGLRRGGELAFIRGFCRSYRLARKMFRQRTPSVALAMGGFTSAPPVLAAKALKAKTFLHESNSIPGRANRWLSWTVDGAFLGFASAASRLHTRSVTATGTPVRRCFKPRDAADCRAELGLDPRRPVLLVVGGSQGAAGINQMLVESLPLLANCLPDLQFLHLTGPADLERVRGAYAALKLKALVHPFFHEMDIALGAATLALSRAGASALAELAAMRVPSVLVPYPASAANHQLHNARAYEATGAARVMEQERATAEGLAQLILELVDGTIEREKMQAALTGWHKPRAAEEVAESMLEALGMSGREIVAKAPVPAPLLPPAWTVAEQAVEPRHAWRL